MLLWKGISCKSFSYSPLLDKSNWFVLTLKIRLQILYGQIYINIYVYIRVSVIWITSKLLGLRWNKNSVSLCSYWKLVTTDYVCVWNKYAHNWLLTLKCFSFLNNLQIFCCHLEKCWISFKQRFCFWKFYVTHITVSISQCF